jgi:hypothetical protein
MALINKKNRSSLERSILKKTLRGDGSTPQKPVLRKTQKLLFLNIIYLSLYINMKYDNIV